MGPLPAQISQTASQNVGEDCAEKREGGGEERGAQSGRTSSTPGWQEGEGEESVHAFPSSTAAPKSSYTFSSNQECCSYPIQVDLQLESGEYFLKSHEKEAREAKKRKDKVRTFISATATCVDPSSSKKKSPPNDEQSVQKHSLRLMSIPPLRSRRSGNGSMQRNTLVTIRMRRHRRRRKRKFMKMVACHEVDTELLIICGSVCYIPAVMCQLFARLWCLSVSSSVKGPKTTLERLPPTMYHFYQASFGVTYGDGM